MSKALHGIDKCKPFWLLYQIMEKEEETSKSTKKKKERKILITHDYASPNTNIHGFLV